MEPESSSRKLELRFIQLYFWMYWMLFINGTYLNLFLKREVGLTGTQIGMLAGTLSISSMLLTPLIGIRFDHSKHRPAFLAALALLAGAAFCTYSTPVPWWALLPVAVVFACGWPPIIPLVDTIASSEHVTSASKRGYGGYRRWGTVGFAAAGAMAGQLTGWWGIRAIFPAYAACAVAVAWLLRGIPDRAAAGHHAIEESGRIPHPRDVLELLRMPNFRRFLAVVLFSTIGSVACYQFRAIYLSSIGLSDTAIGRLTLLIIPGEVVCFTYAARWQRRFGTGPLVMTGLILAGIRWISLGYVRIPALYAVELLHGIGFAMYQPAAIAFVQREAPPRLRGTAQILFFSTAAGLGGAVGSMIAGRIYDALGMRAVLWWGGSLLIIGGLLQLLLVRHHRPQAEPLSEARP